MSPRLPSLHPYSTQRISELGQPVSQIHWHRNSLLNTGLAIPDAVRRLDGVALFANVTNMKETIDSVQTLRAVAALFVVYLHTTSPTGLNLWPSIGNFGVDIFFVISGFIISYMTETDPSSFLLKRAIRILPFYWLATISLFLIGTVAPHLLRTTEANIPLLVHSLLFVPYAHGVPSNTEPLLKLGWTLNYEMYFYIALWLAMQISHAYRALICCALLVLVSALVDRFGGGTPELAFYADPIVAEFMLGILSFYIYSRAKGYLGSIRHSGFVALSLFLVVLAGIGLCAMLESEERQYDPQLAGRVIYLGIPAFIVVTASTLVERVYHIRLGNIWSRRLGDASYVLYLIHPFIIFGITRLALRGIQPNEIARWLFVPVLLVLTSAVAMAIYSQFEKPVLAALRQKFVPRNQTVAEQQTGR